MLLPAKPPAPAPDPHPAGSADRRGAAIAGAHAAAASRTAHATYPARGTGAGARRELRQPLSRHVSASRTLRALLAPPLAAPLLRDTLSPACAPSAV